MKRCAALLVLGVMATVLSACDPGVPSTAAVAVRDSLGVRIVEHRGELVPTGSITLAAEPRFRYGVTPEDYQFQFIGDGALQPDGGAIIIDAGNQEVILLRADGTLRKILARSGEGPGEVKRALTVHAIGQDTVLIEDDGNGKFMFFADGVLSESIGTGAGFDLTQGLMIRGLDARGRFIMTTSAFSSRFDEPWLQGSVVSFDASTARADTIARFDMASRRSRAGPEHPFGYSGSAVVSRGRVVLARTDVPELRWLSSEGELTQIMRWEPAKVYPGDGEWEMFESYLRASLRRVNPGLGGAGLDELIESQVERYEVDRDVPLPIFGALHPDGAGGIWLEDYQFRARDDSSKRLSVISEGGEVLGVVTIPEGLRILGIRGDRVLGVLRDDFEVQSVVVFDVIRSDSQEP